MKRIEKFILSTTNGKEFFNLSDITYIKSDGAYSHIHFIDGKRKTVSKKLKDILVEFGDERFFRIHHSYIVNIEYAVELEIKESTKLTIVNDIKLPVSRRKKTLFLNTFIKL